MSNDTSNSGGIGLLGMLGILFIGLKLTAVINWSWWWVLLPLYGGIILVFLIALIAVLTAVVVAR